MTNIISQQNVNKNKNVEVNKNAFQNVIYEINIEEIKDNESVTSDTK